MHARGGLPGAAAACQAACRQCQSPGGQLLQPLDEEVDHIACLCARSVNNRASRNGLRKLACRSAPARSAAGDAPRGRGGGRCRHGYSTPSRSVLLHAPSYSQRGVVVPVSRPCCPLYSPGRAIPDRPAALHRLRWRAVVTACTAPIVQAGPHHAGIGSFSLLSAQCGTSNASCPPPSPPLHVAPATRPALTWALSDARSPPSPNITSRVPAVLGPRRHG